jgi:hypothetical protein
MPFFYHLLKALTVVSVLATTCHSASLQTVKDWGDNPSGISQMQIYVPDKLATKPAIILGVSFPLGFFHTFDAKYSCIHAEGRASCTTR